MARTTTARAHRRHAGRALPAVCGWAALLYRYRGGLPNGANPPIDVRAFDPYDPLYNEPRQPLAETYFHDSGDTQSGAYVNLRLTAFDRLHLTTGVRYSRYKNIRAAEGICAKYSCSPTDADELRGPADRRRVPFYPQHLQEQRFHVAAHRVTVL